MPSPIARLKSFNRNLAQRIDYHIGNEIRTRWLRRYLYPLMQRGPVRVLDAGCGAGQHTVELAARFPQAQILGLDNRPEAITFARDLVKRRGLKNVHFDTADLTQPLATGDYDIVYSVDVIEHIAADEAMLAVLAQALRPGGSLLVHTPLTPQRHFLRRFDLDQNVNELHVREGYERGELEAKAAAAGFQDSQTVYTHGSSGTFAWEIWQLARPLAPLKWLAKPFLMALVAWETRRKHSYGNCILLVAQK